MTEGYRVVRALGKGAYGTCYLVEAKSDQSLCVIKQIDIRLMNQTEKDETIREALIMKKLNHPNIVRFRDAYITKKGKLCIVMDYADGGDLQSNIKAQNGEYYPEEQVLDWFIQVCLALKHVHDRKVLHRDLKAQNVFLTSKGVVKLGDFGIAKVLDKTSDNAKTMVGTPYYLSPEIIENRPYNFKSDVWSIGVILYELCALRPPFDAPSLHQLALKIVRGTFAPLPSVYSRELNRLVFRLLSSDPNRRPSLNDLFRDPLIVSAIQRMFTTSLRSDDFSQTLLRSQGLIFTEQPSRRRREESKHREELKGEAQEPEEKSRVVEELRHEKKQLKKHGKLSENERQIMLYEFTEVMLEQNKTPPEDSGLGTSEFGNTYEKIEALRMYLEEQLGSDTFIAAYQVIQSFVGQPDVGLDQYTPHLKGILSRKKLLEYIPFIQTLIELENSVN